MDTNSNKNKMSERDRKFETRRSFANILYNSLPERIRKDLETAEYSFVDFGCEDGAGTALLAEYFPNCRFQGIDYYDIIEKAKPNMENKRDNCIYKSLDSDIESLEAVDVVYSSNLLAQIEPPIVIVKKLVKLAKKYAIFIIPFEDDFENADIITLCDIDAVSLDVENDYNLRHFSFIDCIGINGSYPPKKTILLVYQKKSENSQLSINEIYHSQLKELIDSDVKHRQSQLPDDTIGRDLLDLSKKESNDNIIILEEAIETIQNLKTSLAAASNSIPFKMAHFSVEIKNILIGSKKDKLTGFRWLARDRGITTNHNYLGIASKQSDKLESLLQKGWTNTIEFREEVFSYDEMKSVVDFIISSNPKAVFVHPSLIDWNVPMFQRPQQIFMSLGRIGFPVIYFTWNAYDKIEKPYVVSENVLLLKATNMIDIRRKIGWISRFLEMLEVELIVDLYSTGNIYDLSIFDCIESKDFKILYEYVDEISTEIAGMEIPVSHMKMHETFLEDEDVYVVATAEKLYEDALSFRKTNNNVICSGNGVDINHFRIEPDDRIIPQEIKDVVKDFKPIIGYFGAIATWFDFELVKKAAEMRPEYVFMIIGPLYGDLEEEEVNNMRKYNNIVMPGAIDYKLLPNIANYFTVATIPFVINEITESTSPIKLFEYMAMGKPVVTTPMRECIKIPEVMIAKDVEEYVNCLDHAVKIIKGPNRNEYEKKMISLAETHSWENKAEEIVKLVCE